MHNEEADSRLSLSQERPVIRTASWMMFWSLAVKSLGVIYGDIGTSPLYVLNSIFLDKPEKDSDVIGGVSLVIWSLLLMVTLKYVAFVLQADDNGEGGTFALASLVTQSIKRIPPKMIKELVFLISLVGASFIIADGALTPAISILSAVEGLKTFNEGFEPAVMPITIIIIILLFAVQRFGTSKVGFFFGPCMAVWFFSLAAIGIYRIHEAPKIFAAFNPIEGVRFLVDRQLDGFLSLGGVFLAITGLEALYADLGHFGAGPIRTSWCGYVLPALILNYLGQGALILSDRDTYSTPFFSSVPNGLFWPMFIESVVATVIASQAMITGCYSLISQAASLEICPPVKVVHTSKTMFGQIYVPAANWTVMIMTIAVVAGFGSSAAIAHAYGVTVCTGMLLTTFVYSLVMYYNWGVEWWKIIPFTIFFGFLDLCFWAANLAKVHEGGWVSLLLAFIYSVILASWAYGQRKLFSRVEKRPMFSLDNLISKLHEKELHHHKDDPETEVDMSFIKSPVVQVSKLSNKEVELPSGPTRMELKLNSDALPEEMQRVPGLGVFIGTSQFDVSRVPTVFSNFVKRIHGVPRTVVFLTIQIVPTSPVVAPREKLTVTRHSETLYSVHVKYGYSEKEINALDILDYVMENGLMPHDNLEPTTFFVNRFYVIPDESQNLPHRIWISVYGILRRIFSDSLFALKIPESCTVEVGTLHGL